MNTSVHRRLAQLQVQLQETSMRDYSGDPNYLGQKVNSPYSAIVSVGVAASADLADATAMILTTAESVSELGLSEAQAADFAGSAGSVAVAYGGAAARVFAVGVGPAAGVTSESLRSAVAAGVKAMKSAKITDAFVILPAGTPLAAERIAADVSTAAVLADYSFDIYINDDERKFHISELTLVSDAPGAAEAADVAYKIASGQCAARDLANTRAGVATPQYMEDRAADLAAEYPDTVTLQVVDEEEMIEKGMGLIYGVGKAAPSGPRIVYLSYKGDPSSSETLALVGKGLCYDTGGLNLKGSGNIETMYTDKHGACTVLGTMKAIAALGPKCNILGAMALAENAIGEDAQHPYDIVKSYKGLTVHIDNTDAEGRLVLADTLTYTQKHFDGVDTIFDYATLTGACVTALGSAFAGIWCNDDAVASTVTDAALSTAAEKVWRMPWEEWTKELEHPECDIKHMGGAGGGANSAAAFIERFVEDGVKWSHFDIAGASGTPGDPLAGNGWGVQTTMAWILAERC